MRHIDLQCEVARANGFLDWTDFCAKSVRSLGAEGLMKIVKRMTQWYIEKKKGSTRKEGMFDRYKKSRKSKQRIAYYKIYQPDVNYPNDDVLIWKAPDRKNRGFLLRPGTKVDVVETVDGDKYGSKYIMYKIKTADGRSGWVSKKYCKQYYK